MKCCTNHSTDQEPVRRRYVVPKLQRVELAIDETLGAGCKVDSDDGCLGPPITAYNAGS